LDSEDSASEAEQSLCSSDDEDAGVEDLEGFFEAEAIFEESEDIAEDVPKDCELEEPDAFASLAWGLSSELCSQ